MTAIPWPVSLRLKPPPPLAQLKPVFAALSPPRAMMVGGAVRDWVSGRPLVDIDIATTLTPERVLARLRGAGIRRSGLAGMAYGTVAAMVGGLKVEITTLRQDVATYGRAAKVKFGKDWQADAERRDFTFNALYGQPNGHIYDPFGGIADLRAGLVRFIGTAEQRILEDHLRILRFFRFLASYGGKKVDKAALAACVSLKAKLKELSGERILAELLKLLQSPRAETAIRLMNRHRITELISPQLKEHRRLFAHIKNGFATEPMAALAAWLSAASPQDYKALAAGLKLSNKQLKSLKFIHGAPDRDWRLAILKAPDKQAADDWARLQATMGRLAPAQLKRVLALKLPPFPLGGDDMVKLGFQPSARMGRVLAEVKKWWAQNDYKPDKRACEQYVGNFRP